MQLKLHYNRSCPGAWLDSNVLCRDGFAKDVRELVGLRVDSEKHLIETIRRFKSET